MSTTHLYHGPSAREAAIQTAHLKGRLLAPPFGDQGLKVDQAREIVSLLKSVPVGTSVGVAVVGPIDQTSKQRNQVEKINDAFLKVIEEPSEYTCLVLWAWELENVRPTVRSRCLHHWCPPTSFQEDEEIERGGRDLIRAALSKDSLYQIPALAKQFSGREHELIGVMSETLCESAEASHLALWERLRVVAGYSNPTTIELIAALLP